MEHKSSCQSPQGDATLAGAVFEVYNISSHPVWVDKNGDGTKEEYASIAGDKSLMAKIASKE